MKKFVNRTYAVVTMRAIDLRQRLTEQRTKGYVDTAIKTLIAVVLGASLLAGLYALSNDTVLSTFVHRVQKMLDYAG